MEAASLSVAAGECVALIGNSGAGKSTLMRMIYGNDLTAAGRIMRVRRMSPALNRARVLICGAIRLAMFRNSCASCRVCRRSM